MMSGQPSNPSSAAGPDSISIDIYKSLDTLAVDLIHEIANAMLDGTDIPDDEVNLAFMVCIPKEPDQQLNDGTSVYKPGSVSPLSSGCLQSFACFGIPNHFGALHRRSLDKLSERFP